MHAADSAVCASIELYDAAQAGRDAEEIAAADAAIGLANKEYRTAIDALAACDPSTKSGIRAMLVALARLDAPDPDWLKDAINRLAKAPVLSA